MGYSPFLASQMVYKSYLPHALKVSLIATPNSSIVVRLLNNNDEPAPVSIDLGEEEDSQSDSSHFSAYSVMPLVEVMTLSSPLFGTALFDEYKGGWNSLDNPNYIIDFF